MKKLKMSLRMFENEKLQIAQLLEVKGGSGNGNTNSTSSNTHSSATDQDCLNGDCD
jgi:hypothetical protein